MEFISLGIFPLKMTLTESPVRDSLRIKWARTEIEIQMLVENKTWGVEGGWEGKYRDRGVGGRKSENEWNGNESGCGIGGEWEIRGEETIRREEE